MNRRMFLWLASAVSVIGTGNVFGSRKPSRMATVRNYQTTTFTGWKVVPKTWRLVVEWGGDTTNEVGVVSGRYYGSTQILSGEGSFPPSLEQAIDQASAKQEGK